jgi:multimeric flavodoxin WrbA
LPPLRLRFCQERLEEEFVVKPSIVLLNASERKYGCSSQLLHVAAEGVRDAQGKFEIVHLSDHTIKPCSGCASDVEKFCKYPCLIEDDDFNAIASKLIEAQGFVVATPVYWYAPNGVLKNFIDRLTSLENMIDHVGKSLLEGKVAGFIAAGSDSGVMMAISYMVVAFNSMGVHIVPWSMAYTHSQDPTEDVQAMMDAYNVGLLVTKIARILMKNEPVGYESNVDLERLKRKVERIKREFNGQRALRMNKFKLSQ